MSFRLDIDINGCSYIVNGNNDQLPEVAARLFPPAPSVSTEPLDPSEIKPYELFRLHYIGEHKISAIKEFRQLTRCGLKEAKDAIEGVSALNSESKTINYLSAAQLAERLLAFGRITVTRA